MLEFIADDGRATFDAEGRDSSRTAIGARVMEEFEGGFLRSLIIGLILALGFSIVFVWFR
jgi:hypothetical protein